MQFVEKVAALRLFLGVPTELQLQPAVEHMNTMMGLVGDGALPLQVDALIAASSPRRVWCYRKKRACEEARTVSYLKSQKRHAPFLNATVS